MTISRRTGLTYKAGLAVYGRTNQNGEYRVKVKSVCLLVVLLLVFTPSTWAQSIGSSGWDARTQPHKIEISPYGGYLWSQSADVQIEEEFGKLDITSGSMWGIEVDINVTPGGQAVLLYQRQDTELIYQPTGGAKQTVGDFAVEFWQVGALGGTQNGKTTVFGLMTLGGTRFIPKFVGGSDEWKFSIMFGLGAKLYVTERIGLRVQGMLPWVITSGSAVISCGGYGCYTAFGGTGIAQASVSAGLIFMF